MTADQKKLSVAVGLLVVAGGVYFFVGRKTTGVPSSVKYVCVATGEIKSFSRDDIPPDLPAVNAKTGQATLLPIVEQNGKMYVDRHYSSALRGPDLAKVNKYVDPESLEVLKSPRP